MGSPIAFTAGALVTVAVILLLLVLCQKGRGTGLLGGSGHTVLGTKSAEAMTWVTAAAFAVFLLLAVLLNRMVG